MSKAHSSRVGVQTTRLVLEIGVMVAVTVTAKVKGAITDTVIVRLRPGGGVGRSALVAMPDSVHSTFIELQLLMPQHHIHIPP